MRCLLVSPNWVFPPFRSTVLLDKESSLFVAPFTAKSTFWCFFLFILGCSPSECRWLSSRYYEGASSRKPRGTTSWLGPRSTHVRGVFLCSCLEVWYGSSECRCLSPPWLLDLMFGSCLLHAWMPVCLLVCMSVRLSRRCHVADEATNCVHLLVCGHRENVEQEGRLVRARCWGLECCALTVCHAMVGSSCACIGPHGHTNCFLILNFNISTLLFCFLLQMLWAERVCACVCMLVQGLGSVCGCAV